jgi:tRNA pseudouridine55 synthase
MTSAQAVARVKRSLRARKVGHAGTLDPFATGLLICCVNQATRLARFLLHGKKRYLAELYLGMVTDTQDGTGRVTAIGSTTDITDRQVRSTLQRFTGCQWQKPPIYSALKHRGVPLYRYARNGQPVEKPARRICIESIQIRSLALPKVQFELVCTAGTYVRTLCADVGEALGCGGHLASLRRTACSGFELKEAVDLEQMDRRIERDRRNVILPMAEALRDMPGIDIDNALTKEIKHGRMIPAETVPGLRDMPDGPIKALEPNGRLVAVVDYHHSRRHLKYYCVFD